MHEVAASDMRLVTIEPRLHRIVAAQRHPRLCGTIMTRARAGLRKRKLDFIDTFFAAQAPGIETRAPKNSDPEPKPPQQRSSGHTAGGR
jgi:hypothetical protein